MKSDFKIFKQIINLLNGSIKKNFYLAIVFLILGMLVEFLSIYIIFPLIDFLKDDKNIEIINELFNLSFSNREFIVVALSGFLIIYLARFFLLVFLNYVLNKIIQSLHKYIFQNIYVSIQKLDYKNLLKTNKSDIINLLQLDLNRFTKYLTSFFQLISESVLIFGIMTALLIMKPIETILLFLISFPFFYLSTVWINKKMNQLGNENVINLNETTDVLDLTHSFYKEIKIFDLINYFQSKASNLIDKSTKIWLSQAILNILPRYFLETFSVLFFITYLLTSLIFLNKDLLELISVASVFGLSAVKLLPSLGKFSLPINEIKFNQKSTLLIINRLKENHSDYYQFSEMEINNLSLKDGFFKFNKTSQIKNISFNVESGDRLLIKGISGSGKSTLINLILGLYYFERGEFKINNKIIYEPLYSVTSIGYVSQNTLLFDQTLIENIVLNKELDTIKINKIKQACLLDDLFESFSENLTIGINGNKLSGGQKQRLSIARALYHYNNLLILDEATSSMDKEIEKAILDNIFRYNLNDIIIFTTHNNDYWGYSTKTIEIK